MTNERLSDPPVTYVTQKDWDACQAALRASLPLVRASVPPLSTSGTALSLLRQVEAAIKPRSTHEPSGEHVQLQGEVSWTFHQNCRCLQCRHAYRMIEAAQNAPHS